VRHPHRSLRKSVHCLGAIKARRTVACALWHLEVERLVLVFLAHVVVEAHRRILRTEAAAGCEKAGSDSYWADFAVCEGISEGVLEERGADKVG
jgi:hypothetical protein